MDRHEIALNYDRYGRPIGQHRERGLTLQKKLSVNAEESLDEILEPLVDYMESDEPAPNPNNPMYWAWKQTVEAGGPHSHIFTLAFKRPYSDQQAIAALSDWATMMNRRIKGPRWKKKAHGLAGVAFAERHSLSLDFRGRLHFHVLIKTEDGIPTSDTMKGIAYPIALGLKDARGMSMTDQWRIDLREVTNEHRLIGYLLKRIYSQEWQTGDNIAFWRPDKGIAGFQFTPQSSSQLLLMH